MAIGGAAGRFGGGAGAAFRLADEVHGDGRACADDFLDSQAVLAGFEGVEVGAKGAPGFGLIGDKN